MNRPRRQQNRKLASVRKARGSHSPASPGVAAKRPSKASRLKRLEVREMANAMVPTDPGLRAFLEGIAAMAADAVLYKMLHKKGTSSAP